MIDTTIPPPTSLNWLGILRCQGWWPCIPSLSVLLILGRAQEGDVACILLWDAKKSLFLPDVSRWTWFSFHFFGWVFVLFHFFGAAWVTKSAHTNQWSALRISTRTQLSRDMAKTTKIHASSGSAIGPSWWTLYPNSWGLLPWQSWMSLQLQVV